MRDSDNSETSAESDKAKAKQLAEAGLSSVMLNAFTAKLFAQGAVGEMDFFDALSVVVEKTKRITENDTKALEITLAAQVGSLDAIYTEMARRAAINMGEKLHATDTYMRLALKAQAQCARTIEVLANIKNPPVIYARQANIANGHQQINNGVPIVDNPRTHVEKVENQQNELLSGSVNERLDIGAAATPGRANQKVEAVGAKHRRKNI